MDDLILNYKFINGLIYNCGTQMFLFPINSFLIA